MVWSWPLPLTRNGPTSCAGAAAGVRGRARSGKWRLFSPCPQRAQEWGVVPVLRKTETKKFLEESVAESLFLVKGL